ncbi:lysylphosphatidylglycerol synthase transmembrane domain-containing protein [Streptomyces sp. NPDC093109]|uniref:lysylphosphatidylglycerol synthase transmembrane domain-containing protein n=1 Tax=Streptomyces sp. NPDC093109 TaxID=3154977 RepID=UPI00344DDD74
MAEEAREAPGADEADGAGSDGTDGTGGRESGPPPSPVRARRRPWWILSAVVIAAAVAVAVSRRDELASALRLLSAVRPARLGPVAVCEAASLTCLAALQWRLLRMGGARLRFGLFGGMVLAANAVAGALPGGAAFAAGWLFGQLRRRGVPGVLAGSALAVSGLLSALALFSLLVAGVLTGGSAGPAGLRSAVLWPTAVLLVLAAGAVALSRLAPVRRRAWRLWRRLGVRSRRMWHIEDGLSRLARDVRARRRGRLPWLTPFALALANWVLDAACLLACAWALGIGIPWRGILVAYCLTQLTGALRLTPGGLGVVEASLTTLLVLYGLRADQAIALTLLYRIASYWALQPIGWASWLGITAASRLREKAAENNRSR